MPQRREVTCSGVTQALPDLVPVGHVEEARDHVAAQRSQCLVLENGRPDGDEEHHREQRREEAPRSAKPEVAQRDPVGPLALGDQQQRDQVPRDHEEHLDTEESAGQPVAVGVVHHHRHDSERPHPVESRKIRDPADVDAVVGNRFHSGWGERGHGSSSIAEQVAPSVSCRPSHDSPFTTTFALHFGWTGSSESARKRGWGGDGRIRRGLRGLRRSMRRSTSGRQRSGETRRSQSSHLGRSRRDRPSRAPMRWDTRSRH